MHSSLHCRRCLHAARIAWKRCSQRLQSTVTTQIAASDEAAAAGCICCAAGHHRMRHVLRARRQRCGQCHRHLCRHLLRVPELHRARLQQQRVPLVRHPQRSTRTSLLGFTIQAGHVAAAIMLVLEPAGASSAPLVRPRTASSEPVLASGVPAWHAAGWQLLRLRTVLVLHWLLLTNMPCAWLLCPATQPLGHPPASMLTVSDTCLPACLPAYRILAIGGTGIVVGLATYGACQVNHAAVQHGM